MKAPLFYPALCLLIAMVGCTDLSKVERKDKKDPLEPEKAKSEALASKDTEEKVEAPAKASPPKAVPAVPAETVAKYPFERTIEDSNGRVIDVQIIAKEGNEVAFQRQGTIQRFVVPLEKLSEKDKAFLNGLSDGGGLGAVKHSLAKAVELSARSASWHRVMDRAEKEAELLKIPRLTAILILNDPLSETIEKDILYTTEFREWAGKHVVLTLIKVEPPGSRMAMTDEKAENRRAAGHYGVKKRPAVMLNIPGDDTNFFVSLKLVTTPGDLIRQIQIVLDNPLRVDQYIEGKDAVD